MFFDDIKTLYDLDAPETGRITVEQTYSDYRKGDKARLDSLGYLPLQDLKVIDLDTAKPFTPVKEGKGDVREARRADHREQAERAHPDHRHAQGVRLHRRRRRARVRAHAEGLRNTVLLPEGWDVSGVSQSGTIGTERASGRAFVALDQSERRKQLQGDDPRAKGAKLT